MTAGTKPLCNGARSGIIDQVVTYMQIYFRGL